MLGSTASVADPNTVLNTIVAEALCQFADRLEGAEDFNSAVNELVKETISLHMRIIFNGNGYSEEWKNEAERRGLLNLVSTVDALPQMIEPKNIDVFVKHKVYSESEVRSRYEILLESYSKTVNIEALTAIDMVRKQYIPAVSSYISVLSDNVLAKKGVSSAVPCKAETEIIERLSALLDEMYEYSNALEKADTEALALTGYNQARAFRDNVLPIMDGMRNAVDSAETVTADEYWPVATYGELMFKV